MREGTFEVCDVLDVLESALLLQLFSHWHVSSLPTDIRDICTTVPVSLAYDVVQGYVLGDCYVLQVYSNQLFAAFFSW